MELKQYVEVNTATLGLIPIQSRLPEAFMSKWEVREGDRENGRSISCHAGGPTFVPHGFAGDILAALMTLSIAASASGNNEQNPVIETDRQELLKLIGMSPSSHSYGMIDQYLDSVRYANYTISNSWQTPLHQIKRNVSIGLIDFYEENIIKTIERQGRKPIVHIRYNFKLNDVIWASALGGMTLALNPQILAQMSSPSSRGLYRILEAQRYQSQNQGQGKKNEIVILATSLLDATRTLSHQEGIARQLRNLSRTNGPFDQLSQAKYLQSIDTIGYGDKTRLVIRFTTENTIISTAGEKLLLQHGVLSNQARMLAQSHTTEEVECAIWLTEEAAKTKTIHTPSGFLINLLRNGSARDALQTFKNRPRRPAPTHTHASPQRPEPLPEVIPETETIRRNIAFLMNVKKISKSTAEVLKVAAEEGKVLVEQLSISQPLIRDHQGKELEDKLLELLESAGFRTAE